MHSDDGTLRRSIDEPDSMDGAERAHLGECEACRGRIGELEGNASFARQLLSADGPAFELPRVATIAVPRNRPAWMAPAIALAAAACLVCAIAFTPLGSVAGQWLTIFEPKQFVPLDISATDSEQLRLMPSLERLGTFVSPKAPPPRRVSSLAGIDRTLGFEPRELGEAPRARPGETLVQASFVGSSFTFSGAKTRKYEADFNRSLPAMPPGLDGTTFTVTYGPTLVQTFGDDEGRVWFVQTKAPRLVSTGASLETAGNYILSLPNMPAHVAAQLRAIADPEHTLPIPFGFDRAAATPVTVDGSPGMAIGDETRFGAGVVWTKDGVAYAIGGQIKKSEALALANSIK
jgi:hypothetical protein